MIAQLPTWYNVAKISPITQEAYESRSSVVKELIKVQNEAFFLECIRLYLGIPVENNNFLIEFSKPFNLADPMVLTNGQNILEMRVLAGAAVATAIDTHANGISLAFALQSGKFGLNETSLVNVDIIDTAGKFLDDKAGSLRSPNTQVFSIDKLPVLKDEGQTIETLLPQMKSMTVYVKNAMTQVQTESQYLHKKISILEEESNIHWWLFRNYSQLRNCAINELDSKEGIFILASELAGLFFIAPANTNRSAFLSKAYSNLPSIPEIVTIRELVELLRGPLNDIVLNTIKQERYGNLTPLNFAYSKGEELNFSDTWIELYDRKSGVKAASGFQSLEIGAQYLTESLLNKL